jgi:putative Holliday junction resolvase
MGRLIGIDYGLKRTGIAVSDPLKLFASPLETIPSNTLYQYLEQYMKAEEVDGIVIGMPIDLKGRDTDSTKSVRTVIKNLKKKFPNTPVTEEDERFTSKMALDAMIEGGSKKKDRQEKGNIDKISASIILQSFMDK